MICCPKQCLRQKKCSPSYFLSTHHHQHHHHWVRIQMVTVESSFAQTKSSMQSILFDLVCITITASSTSTQLNSAFLAVTTINCKIGADETATTNVKLLDLMKKLGCPNGMCDDHLTNGEKLIQLPNANLSVIILCWALMSEGVQSHGFEGVDTKRRVTAACPYLSDAISICLLRC